MSCGRQGKTLGIIGYVAALAWFLLLVVIFHQIASRGWQYAMLGTVWSAAIICWLAYEDKRRYRTTHSERKKAIAREKERDRQAGIIKSEEDYNETLGPPWCREMPFFEQKLLQLFVIHAVAGVMLGLIKWLPGIYDKLFWYLPTVSIKWPGF